MWNSGYLAGQQDPQTGINTGAEDMVRTNPVLHQTDEISGASHAHVNAPGDSTLNRMTNWKVGTIKTGTEDIVRTNPVLHQRDEISGAAHSNMNAPGDSTLNRMTNCKDRTFSRQLNELIDDDRELCCPVSLMLFEDPVVASDGFAYERTSLVTLMQYKMRSPMTRESFTHEVRPDPERRSRAMAFRKMRAKELLLFAEEILHQDSDTAGTALGHASVYVQFLEEEPEVVTNLRRLQSHLGLSVSADEPCCFHVGDCVRVRDRPAEIWRVGRVSEVSPLKVLADGHERSHSWNHVERLEAVAAKLAKVLVWRS